MKKKTTNISRAVVICIDTLEMKMMMMMICSRAKTHQVDGFEAKPEDLMPYRVYTRTTLYRICHLEMRKRKVAACKRVRGG